MRIIMHVDLDAFYAACEERENKLLRGKPVVVGADPAKGRGVVATANYAARRYGISSGMPITRAYSICPQAEYLRPDFPLYVRVSENVMEILQKYAGAFEQVSIDEAYLDVSSAGNYKEAEQIANNIKKGIWDEESLSCSIGIGPNKLVAKIASDYKKPDGLTVVSPDNVSAFLFPLPVRCLPGVGKKTGPAIEKIGIKTIGDLAKYDKQKLIEYFGRFGVSMYEFANGIENSEVSGRWETKSIGKETTFERDTTDVAEISKALSHMSEIIHEETKEQSLAFRTVAIKLRYLDFQTLTRQASLQKYSRDVATIKNTALGLFKKTYTGRPVRLIGVRVTNLASMKNQKTVREFAKNSPI